MKTLRSYMNDLEEEAAKRSAEEQRQRTAMDAHDADIAQVRAQAKQASKEAEQLAKARAQVCVEMTEKQVRMATLEVECATLKQTLELIHQEIASTSAKLNEKRLFYTTTMEKLTVNLREQQEWLGSFKNKMITIEPPVEASCLPLTNKQESDVRSKLGELRIQLESGQLRIGNIKAKKSGLLLEINKSKEILEQEKNIIAGFPAALQQMDMKSLKEEYKALQGDKAEEVEYFQSLEERINEMKEVSDPVKCHCGLEYKVELGVEAMDIS